MLTYRSDKRLPIAIIFLVLTAIVFWSGTRYPALDEKATLGTDNGISGLAFDQIIDVLPDEAVATKIMGHAVNWAYTNRQGMAFGIAFAALILTLLQLTARRAFNGWFANTLLGVAMGAPLGVCVNCAVPVAVGVHRAGGKLETTLATMFSSPTLNILVLSMTFALFPPWLAALKLGLTLVLIVFLVPLVLHLLHRQNPPKQADLNAVLPSLSSQLKVRESEDSQLLQTLTWARALLWVGCEVLYNLWYIIRTTLPLMALAGILGAVVVALVPWHNLVGFNLPDSGGLFFAALTVLALIGTFLPVPIAFDIVICSVLLSAGLDPAYVAVLLVTLGLFSIYPLLQLGRLISWRLAMSLYFLVVVVGMATGVCARDLNSWEQQRQEKVLQGFLQASTVGPVNSSNYSPDKQSKATILDKLEPYRILSAEVEQELVFEGQKIVVSSTPFQPSSNLGEQLFSSYYGPEMGVDEPDNISAYRFMEPLIANRSIASGDVHNDGWPDLLFTSETGVALYANVGGKHFIRQNIGVNKLAESYPLRAALVDIDGDADLDIVVATATIGILYFANNNGNFTTPAINIPGQHQDAIPGVLAFGDIDRDGDLDIVIGNRAIGNNPVNRTVSAARNFYLFRETDGFKYQSLPGPSGETLSILLSDLNGDGWLDIFIGNDYRPPDHLLLSDGLGGLNPVKRSDHLIENTARWTMSLASADLDGDLIPEIYVGNISGRMTAPPRSAEQTCRFETGSEQDHCLARLKIFEAFFAARFQSDAIACKKANIGDFREDCMLIALSSPQMRRGAPGPDINTLCDQFPERWGMFRLLCNVRGSELVQPLNTNEIQQTLKSTMNTNVLLSRKGFDKPFIDHAAVKNIDDAGWTWNARFADLDLNGYQDLYVVNGHTIAKKQYDHRLYLNQGDKFIDQAVESGIASGVPAASYSYVDFDRDGDIDIVTAPIAGPIRIFINNATSKDNHAIEFELRDDSENPYAIGAQLTIGTGVEGSHKQMREIQLSGGFASFDETIVHFGLGVYDRIISLSIRWPDGNTTVVPGEFVAGKRYLIQRHSLPTIKAQ